MKHEDGSRRLTGDTLSHHGRHLTDEEAAAVLETLDKVHEGNPS